jgi:hypothetical protein
VKQGLEMKANNIWPEDTCGCCIQTKHNECRGHECTVQLFVIPDLSESKDVEKKVGQMSHFNNREQMLLKDIKISTNNMYSSSKDFLMRLYRVLRT